MAKTLCKQCGQATGDIEYRLEVVAYPYNPEWSLTSCEAGLFCSSECLAQYLSDAPVVAAKP